MRDSILRYRRRRSIPVHRKLLSLLLNLDHRLTRHFFTPRVELLESRCLLSVDVVSEIYKTVKVSGTGEFSARDFSPFASPDVQPYGLTYGGSSNGNGTLSFLSPTNGRGTFQGSGNVNAILDHGPPDGDPFPFSYTYEGFADFTETNGDLTFTDGQGLSSTLGSSPFDFVGTGTINFSSYPFKFKDIWSVVKPLGGGVSFTSNGTWNVDLTPIDKSPFDIEVQAASWQSFGGVLFDFAAKGQPYAVSDRSTPVAKVEAFFATDTTEDSIVGESLGEVPVYWNQASGRGFLTPLENVPNEARYVLIVADHDHQYNDPNRENNVFPLKIYEEPTVEIKVNPDEPEKSMDYHVTIVVTSNSAVPTEINLDWLESYPANAGDIKLTPENPRGEKSVKTLPAFKNIEIELESLNHKWEWIPKQMPGEQLLDTLSNIATTTSSILQDQLNKVNAVGNARDVGRLGLASDLLSIVQLAVQLAAPVRSVKVPIEVTVSDTANDARFDEVTKDEPIEVTVNTKYRLYYDASILAAFLAGTEMSAGIVSLAGILLPPPLNVVSISAAIQAFVTAGAQFVLANELYKQALDPPAPDFTALTEPVRLVVKELEQSALSFFKIAAYDGLELEALNRAQAASRDRADGAALANDWSWQSIQLLRASDFASGAALLGTRDIARSALSQPYLFDAATVPGEDMATSLQNNGLPPILVDVLTQAGWTAQELDDLKFALIDVSPRIRTDLDMQPSKLITAAFSAASSLNELEQAIQLRVDRLASQVRDLTSEERIGLDELRSNVETVFSKQANSLSDMKTVHDLIAKARFLMLDTNNVAALHDDLDYAYGALFDFQNLLWTSQRLQQFVEALSINGEIGSKLGSDLTALLNQAKEKMLAGDFKSASKSFTSILYAARTASDVAPDVVNKLIDATQLFQYFIDPRPWQNDLNPLFVNDDNIVSPIDALIIINQLNSGGSQALVSPLDSLVSPNVQLDTNGDNMLSPIDALLVINWLNQVALGGEVDNTDVTHLPNLSSIDEYFGKFGGFAPFTGARGVGLFTFAQHEDSLLLPPSETYANVYVPQPLAYPTVQFYSNPTEEVMARTNRQKDIDSFQSGESEHWGELPTETPLSKFAITNNW